MTEEMKNNYPGEWHLGPLTKPTVEPRGYVHLSPEATDQLSRIEMMLKKLLGVDDTVQIMAEAMMDGDIVRMNQDGSVERISQQDFYIARPE